MSCAGMRVLIVDDEPLVAMLLEDMLLDLECVPVGPAGALAPALQLAADGDYDCALLDMNLGGKDSLPVADVVRGRNKPFAFVTGYGAVDVQGPHRAAPTLQKPFASEDLEQLLVKLARRELEPSA